MIRASLRVLVLVVAAAVGTLAFGAPAAHADHDQAPAGVFEPPRYVDDIRFHERTGLRDVAHNGTHIFVAAGVQNAILIYDASGNPAGTIGSAGAGPGRFDGPDGIALSQTHIFVVDKFNHRVQIFDMAGNYVNEFGEFGDGPGQFDTPSAIALSQTHIFVTDWFNGRVQIFDMAGNYVNEFGRFGDGPGDFRGPANIALSQTRVFVTDQYNHRVQVFDMKGNYMDSFGSLGISSGYFNATSGIALSQTHIFVVDFSNNRVQVFDMAGDYVGMFGGYGSRAFDLDGSLGKFDGPRNITLNGTHAFVSDGGNGRVQIFALSEPYAEPPAPATPHIAPPAATNPIDILKLRSDNGTIRILGADYLAVGTLGGSVDIALTSTHMILTDAISGRTLTLALPGN